MNHSSKKYFFALLSLLVLNFLSSCKTSSPTTTDPNGTISGTVLDTSYHAIANAIISTSPPTSQILSDLKGKFSFTDVHPGNYIVSASKNGYGTGTGTILIQAGKTTDVSIILSQIDTNGSIKGTVLDSVGNAVGGATITTIPITVQAFTVSDGSFIIPEITPGSYIVTANKLGKTASASNVIVTAKGVATITIAFQGTSNNANLPTDGLIAFFPLNGTGADATGNGFDLQIQNGSFGTSRKGVVNGALVLTGSGPSAVGSTDSRIEPNPLTISFWMKTSFPQASGRGTLFVSKYVVSTNNGYLFYSFGSDLIWNYGFGSNSVFLQG